jgi:hypothetical protein
LSAISARIDSTEALIQLVLGIKDCMQSSRERARLEVSPPF